jgi:hypothetical protein
MLKLERTIDPNQATFTNIVSSRLSGFAPDLKREPVRLIAVAAPLSYSE